MIEVLRRYFEENRRLLTALAAVLVGNILFYVLLTAPAQLRYASLQSDVSATEKELSTALHEYGRARLEATLFERAEQGMTELYRDIFQTGPVRYPVVDAKVKELAAKYRLEPHSIAYGFTPLTKERLEQMSVSLNLKGSYDNLRQFIADTEQARDASGRDQFFSIEGVTLVDSTDTGAELNLHLLINTYFHKPELEAEEKAKAERRPAVKTGGTR